MYNDCMDLRIQALRQDFCAKTGKIFNTEYLVNDPTNALEFHDRAIGLLRQWEVVA